MSSPIAKFANFIALIIYVAIATSPAYAANKFNQLALTPQTTTLILLDNRKILTDPENQALFRKSGFNVSPIEGCLDNNDHQCLLKSFRTLNQNADNKSLVLIASSAHTKAVYTLYKTADFSEFITAVVLLRTEPVIDPESNEKFKSSPPLLVIAKQKDDHKVIINCRYFTDYMRRAGIWSWFVVLPSGTPPDKEQPPVIKIINTFIGAGKSGDYMYEFLNAIAHWQQPPMNNDGFLEHKELLKTFEVDGYFRAHMRVFFRNYQPEFKQWAFKTYQALDLLQLRDKFKSTKGKRYVIFRNRLGHFQSVDLNHYAEYQPHIVVGIDYETNLFRLASFYRNKASYSWQKDKPRPQFSVNPLGAFMLFHKRPPIGQEIPLMFRSKLDIDSLEFTNEDPLSGLNDLSPDMRSVMTIQNKCINCHSYKGIGGRAHHIVVETGKIQEGYALPLLSYSTDVLKNFLFNQKEVAAIIGATPNPVKKEFTQPLFELLSKE